MTMRIAIALAGALLGAASVQAEDAPPIDRFLWGGAVQLGDPRGTFGEAADTGVGALAHATVRTRGGVVGWRIEGGWLVYGSESFGAPVPGTRGRVTTDVAFTENSVGHAVTGPVIMAPRGPVRPYASAFAGVSYFETATELRPRRLGPAFARETHFADTTFTYGASAGLLVPFGRSGVSLDLGLRYARNHDARYLAEGDVTEAADGSLSFTPRRSDADVLDFRVGVTIGR
jgi:hypothetical protein